MPTIESGLARLGLTLPDQPVAIASYVPASAVHSGTLVFISGQIPMRDGALLATGSVPDQVSLEKAQECARQCVLNGLAALRNELGGLDRVDRVIRVGGFVASPAGYGEQPKVINAASELLVELMGDAGRHARAAVGVSSLPLNVPVEIEFTFVAS